MKPKIPYLKQETEYTCGAASMRMVLASFKIKKSEKQVARLLKTNSKIGTNIKNMILLAKNLHFKYKIKSNASISELKKLYERKFEIILLYYLKKEDVDHYAVLKKTTKNHIYLLDPHEGKNTRYQISEFQKLWNSDKCRKKKWFLAVKLV